MSTTLPKRHRVDSNSDSHVLKGGRLACGLLMLVVLFIVLSAAPAFADLVPGHWSETVKPADTWRHALTPSAIGDVNGDGYDDAFYEIRNPTTGKVFDGLQNGSATGLDPSATIADTQHIQAYFTAVVGDLNSDGYEDIVRFMGVYTPGGAAPGQPDIDRAYLIYGSAGGPNLGDLSNSYKPSTLNQDRSMLRTATSGDFDGDGHLELVLAGWEGPLWAEVPRVFVYDGTANGPAHTYTRLAASDLTGRGTFGANGPNHLAVGDFNGDGYDDLAVASPTMSYSGGPNFYRGAIYVYYGSSSGIQQSSEVRLHTLSTAPRDNFANGLAAGDLNGDGIDDIAAGAAYDSVVTGCGYVGVYYGVAGGVFTNGIMDELKPDCIADNAGRFGTGLDIAEVTGDGYNDLVIGAARSARILRGSANGVSLEDGWVFCPGGWGLSFGDFDGDGLTDMMNNGARQWLGADTRVDADCDGSPDAISLVASWGFDEGSGTVVGDGSGNGHDATLQGGAGWTDGQQSHAGTFDGVDDYAELGDGAESDFDIESSLSIALWVKPESLGPTFNSLVSKDNAYEFELGHAGPNTYGARLGNVEYGRGDTLVVTHAWQHLAMVWDGSTVTYYYNGVPDGSFAYSGPLPLNDSPLGLGARPTPYGPQYPFHGRLDSVMLYNEALSAGEVAALAAGLTDITPPERSNGAPVHALPGGSTSGVLSLDTDGNATCRYSEDAGTDWSQMTPFDTTGGTYHSTTVTGLSDGQIFDYFVRCQDSLSNTNPDDFVIIFAVDDIDLEHGLISAWRFDEGSGCSAGDAFGGNTGSLAATCPGDAPSWVTGMEGGALQFGGGNHAVEVPNSASLSGYSTFSVAAWIQHDDVSGSWRAIADQRDTGADGWSFYIDALGRLYLRVDGKTHVGVALIDDGEWHHVVGTYDGNTIRLYVDTILDASKTVGAETIDVGADLRIGHRFSSNSSSFEGTIDEVMLYDRALSNTDIWELFLDSP